MTNLIQLSKTKNQKLNKIEKLKQSRYAYECWNKLDEYAKNGYDSIPEDDKKYFLKSFGIYDRPKTPKQFMLKLRIPGGRLNATQAREIVNGALKAKDYIDLTTRAQIEIRYLNIEDIPAILRRLDSVKINSFQTGVDNVRGIMCDPFDDLALDNILPSFHLLEKMQDVFLNNPEYLSALPRKFNTAITGNIVNRANVFVHDLCFVLANKDGVYGYNVYLGGKVGVVAKQSDIFVTQDEVVKLFEATIQVFKKYGFRDNRNKARFMQLIESSSMKEVCDTIRDEAGINFKTSGVTLTQLEHNEPTDGLISLKDGSYAVHLVVPSGMFSGTDLKEVARVSEVYGNGEIRLDFEQNIYLLGIKDVDLLLNEEIFKKYKNKNSIFFNHQLACAGTQHCPFGVIENKNDAIELSNYLEQKVGDFAGKISLYWSGCVKGCGIHSLADIGFEGAKAKLDGKSVSGVNISLGGKITDANEGHIILRNIPLSIAKEYVLTLVLEYKRLQKDGESFNSFYNRVLSSYSKYALAFMIKLLTYFRLNGIDMKFGFNENQNSSKIEEFEIFAIAYELYHHLAKEYPYSAMEKFTNPDGEKLKNLKKELPNIDENLRNLLEKMLTHKESLRAIVFSELEDFFIN